MSVDFNSTPVNTPTATETETPMFAPIPSWERNKKRRGFGGGKRAESVREPTIFDAAPDASLAASPDASFAAPMADADETAFAAAPAYATRTVKKSGGMAPLAIAAGIIAVGGLAAAGWYATQPQETGGMAQLTPGTESAAAPVAAPEMAAAAVTPEAPLTATQQAAAAPTRAPTRLAAAPAARTRPAQAPRSAEEAGVNTAATLPAAPQPYSGAAVAPQAPADVTPTPSAPPAWNIPPVSQSPAPAPVEAAPPSITPPAAATPPVDAPPN